ncbi:ribosome recycling factor [Strigomonas culicis]|uniref:Ribosome recycling factor n=1 Tax=Strigomonas culicis TaxID=28005 RepID=S9UMB4_9TRYP|nr:ribosome recycling factor [Strigomonas culicis]|eukprot:EPY31982.1 ribosome recycling factor [Strigomonas culicis]
MLVQEDFPAELEEIFAGLAERASTAAMKVLNMAKCLELLDVDVNPGARQQPGAAQNKILLTKVAQVVKTGPATIEITPTSASFATPILQRISRFDSSLQVGKEQNTIKVSLPPVTTAQRDRAAEEVRHLIAVLRQKCKASRHNATRVLQESGLEDGLRQELGSQMDETVKVFVEEKAEELELLALEVMSMGIDESDKSVQ